MESVLFNIPEKPDYQNRFGFPYKSTLSFLPLIKSLEEKVNSNQPDAMLLIEVLKTIKAIPELNKEIEDLAVLKKYRREVDLLMSTLIPSSLSNEIVTGVMIPFLPVTVFGTQKFHEVIASDSDGIWDVSKMDVQDAFKELIAYVGVAILEKYYQVQLERPDVMRSRVMDKVSGAAGFYKPDIHSTFSEITILKQPKPLSEIDLSPLNENFFDTAFWLKNFPPDTFTFTGIVVYSMIDVTDREMISKIEYSMLEDDEIMSHAGINDLQSKLRSFFKTPDLRLGLVPMYTYMGKMTECGDDSWFCIIKREKMDVIFSNFETSIYKKAIDKKGPYIIEDLTAKYPSKVDNELMEEGIRSIIVAPIFKDDQLIGMMEIGSGKRNAFDFITMLKLRSILPIIAVVVQRNARDYENRIQSTIKENYTSIHPAVEWKFVEAAIQLLKETEAERKKGLAPIQLENVVPIYGQIDIRSSSDRRNEAIRLDIIDYLLSAITLLKEAYEKFSFNIIDELVFRAEKYLDKLKTNMDSGDESGILDFLTSEVKPLFVIIAERDEALKIPINNFIVSLDPAHEHYHMRRKNFEQSLTLINDSVATFMEEEEVRTQKMLPHYFEKYKTDGVEYNIYLGQSILQNGNFDPAYVRNFRLWQLISMVKIARETKAMLPIMSVPLETTQLILCYSSPFSILFRMDEKRFDVAGAYNIRYEIVKKRIDKAHIDGTNERITQPGTIAVIYSLEKEEKEYERYFEYLKARDYINGEVEHIDVEPLQGMQGLKALRIHINYEPGEPKLDWREEELLKEVKGMAV